VIKPNPTTKEVFTAEELAAADPRDIQAMLASRGYTEFWEPLLINKMQALTAELVDPSLPRRWKKPDGYLRGGIAVLRAILNAPYEILNEQEQRNREEADDMSVSQRYEELARGGIGPYGQDRMAVSPSDPI
jgi:hypothetical protein